MNTNHTIQTQSEMQQKLTALLATVIGGARSRQVAEQILSRYGSDPAQLYNAQPGELQTIPGIGSRCAERIAAALRLGVQLSQPQPERIQIQSPADAARLVQGEMSLLEVEHLRVILLDRRNRVKSIHALYKGSVNSSQVRVGEIFRPAVQHLASALILVHNHPSQDPTPSPDDVALTRAVVQAGILMDIQVLDHIIIGGQQFVSLKERGLGFS